MTAAIFLGAMIEWVRKGWASLRGKKDPGPFDVAKLMPVAYVVVLLFGGLFLLTLAADIINPVKAVRLSSVPPHGKFGRSCSPLLAERSC